MSYVINTMTNLASQTGFAFLKPGNFIMVVVALIFLYLAIVKQYEPLLLVPISFAKHTIKNRRTLALGAVVAAEFLCGKKGVYTMDDLLK